MASGTSNTPDSSSTLTVYRWSEDTGRHDEAVGIDAPRQVFTVSTLHTALGKLIDGYPHLAHLPVHLLDMDSNEEGEWGGLLTDIATDVFDNEQGMVLSLTSWPLKDHR